MYSDRYVDDNYLMPYGAHKGKKMANIPDDYLIHMYDQDKLWPNLRDYVKRNWDVLADEMIKQKKK